MKVNWMVRLAVAWFLCGFAAGRLVLASDASHAPLVKRYVQNVVSGNVLQLKDGQAIRLIGVAIPEERGQAANRAEAKRIGVELDQFEKYAAKSKSFLKQLLGRKEIFLVSDSLDRSPEHRDSQGRVLAYAYGKARRENYIGFAQAVWVRSFAKLDDGMGHLDVNATMIQAGYGFVDLHYPFERRSEFEKLEREARRAKRGLWGSGFSL